MGWEHRAGKLNVQVALRSLFEIIVLAAADDSGLEFLGLSYFRTDQSLLVGVLPNSKGSSRCAGSKVRSPGFSRRDARKYDYTRAFQPTGKLRCPTG